MSTPTMASTPPAKSSSKPTKLSKVVLLRMSSDLLARFPSDSKPQSIAVDTPTVTVSENDTADKSTEDAATPMDGDTPMPDDKSSADGAKRKSLPGSKAGTKRAAPIDDTKSKDKGGEKGRPGPKKKPRLADGTIDRTTNEKKPVASTTAAAGHKLGPKANTGAINAGLRALDRSGKPCRRWERKGFQLKSFTGFAWGSGSWSAPQRDTSTFSGDVKSDSSSPTDIKPNVDSSAVHSERSASDAAALQTNGIESSPAPIAAA